MPKIDIFKDGVLTERDMTPEEKTDYDNSVTDFNNKSGDRKLAQIKQIRLQKLMETDYLANSDVTMPDNIKTWRQSLRNIPQDYTTENEYDLLLARDEQDNLTHSIWSKP
jgi:hypothetical protein